MTKYSAHSQYYNSKGDEVPSVTTILKILNKPALVKWANIMGFKRTRTEDVLKKAGEIGTQMHNCIECFFKKEVFNLPEELMHYRDTLLLRLDGFLTWVKSLTGIKPTLLEHKLESDRFGGTMDFYGTVDGLKTILDFKTSSMVHGSMFLQLAGYIIIMEERGYTVDQVGIVHVTEKGTKLHTKTRKEMEPYIYAFEQLLDMFHSWYDLSIRDGWGNICE